MSRTKRRKRGEGMDAATVEYIHDVLLAYAGALKIEYFAAPMNSRLAKEKKESWEMAQEALSQFEREYISGEGIKG